MAQSKITLAELRKEADRVFGDNGATIHEFEMHSVTGRPAQGIRCTFRRGEISFFGSKQRARRRLFDMLRSHQAHEYNGGWIKEGT